MRRTLSHTMLLILAVLCSGFVSTNVPLDHWSYDAIDKLVGYRLIEGSMMTTKPISRLEMARLIAEAANKLEQLDEKNEIILAIFDRLKEEFKAELVTIGLLDEQHVGTFIKPIEDPYVRYVFADKQPLLENQRGDVFNRHSNYRVGFASRGGIFDTVAFYFHPEYVDASSSSDGDIELVEGYGKLALDNIEVEIGKDSLWWGPGYQGSILMSNNAEAFKLIKISNPRPILLPWILGRLGPFKSVWFLTELGENRVIPHAKLTGVRLNFKPTPLLEIGLSRVIMFDGSGRPHVGFIDYIKMFSLGREKPQNNQIAGFDVSLLLPIGDTIPVRSVKVYADLAGEDEAGGLPMKWGKLIGMQLNDILRTGRTDLRVEYASTHVPGSPNVFYTHSLYQSGYTYKGNMIGHHIGTDASDLYFRLTHYLTEDLIVGFEFDREDRNLSSSPRQTTNQFGIDLTIFTQKNWRLRTGYRYETIENNRFILGQSRENHIFDLNFVYNF
jgi:hypothetical protein